MVKGWWVGGPVGVPRVGRIESRGGLCVVGCLADR